MKPHSLAALLLLVLVWGTSGTSTSAAGPTWPDIQYANAGGEAQLRDVQAPASSGSFLIVMLVHGDADKSVPYLQSQVFQTRLHALEVPCELITLPSGPHRLSEWSKFLPDFEVRLIDWLHATL